MDEYDIWNGLTELTPLNYFLGIGVIALIMWVVGLFRKGDDKSKK